MSEPKDLMELIRDAINRTCAENGSNTPDYVLAEFLVGCLEVWNKSVRMRDQWHGRELCPRDKGPIMFKDKQEAKP